LKVHKKYNNDLVEDEFSLDIALPNVAVDLFLMFPHVVHHARHRILTTEPVDAPLAVRRVRAWSVFEGHDVIAIQIG
jgi:hypothetical protein